MEEKENQKLEYLGQELYSLAFEAFCNGREAREEERIEDAKYYERKADSFYSLASAIEVISAPGMKKEGDEKLTWAEQKLSNLAFVARERALDASGKGKIEDAEYYKGKAEAFNEAFAIVQQR
jgi:hypothetical protein